MSLRDVMKPNAAEETELQCLEALLDVDRGDEPGPGFDTRFFARLEEEKRVRARPWWRTLHVFVGAPLLAAAGVIVFVYVRGLPVDAPSTAVAPPGHARAAEVARGQIGAPGLPEQSVAGPSVPAPTPGDAEGGFEADAELALDLDLAEDLDVVEKLDEVEGMDLLAELVLAKLGEKEFERLLAEVRTQ